MARFHVLKREILASFQKIRTDDFLGNIASGDVWGVDELYYGKPILIRSIFYLGSIGRQELWIILKKLHESSLPHFISGTGSSSTDII
jgi:hypothetical protein